MDLQTLITKITQHQLFLRLKNVIENNSYHNQEDVYSHLLKTMGIAQEQITGSFITNPQAKELFDQFIYVQIQGFKRRDIMILIALLHDIGKILSTKEGAKQKSILVTNSADRTFCPNHEYWGSTIVGNFLHEFNLPEEVITYIAQIIKLHDTFGDSYWDSKKSWPWELTLNDIKSRAEGYYKEALFNIYSDCFTAVPFQYGKEMIVKALNDPNLYTKREYVI